MEEVVDNAEVPGGPRRPVEPPPPKRPRAEPDEGAVAKLEIMLPAVGHRQRIVIPLQGGQRWRIGAQSDCEICLAALHRSGVSRYHAEIAQSGQCFFIVNRSLTNATHVGGRALPPPSDRRDAAEWLQLEDGDVIVLANEETATLVFVQPGRRVVSSVMVRELHSSSLLSQQAVWTSHMLNAKVKYPALLTDSGVGGYLDNGSFKALLTAAPITVPGRVDDVGDMLMFHAANITKLDDVALLIFGNDTKTEYGVAADGRRRSVTTAAHSVTKMTMLVKDTLKHLPNWTFKNLWALLDTHAT